MSPRVERVSAQHILVWLLAYKDWSRLKNEAHQGLPFIEDPFSLPKDRMPTSASAERQALLAGSGLYVVVWGCLSWMSLGA